MVSKLIAPTLLIVFFASTAVFVTLSKRPLCIDSRVVEKIDRLTNDGMKTVWKCSYNRSVSFDEKFQRYLPDLNRKLNVVERFFDEVSPLNQPVHVTWLDGMNETVRIQGNQIFISQKLLLATDQLQRSILRIWIREKTGGANIDRTIFEGAMVDLLMYSLGHSPQFEQGNFKWPGLLTSANGLCHLNQEKSFSPLKDIYLMCFGNKNLENTDAQSILAGSGRPIVSESLISAYMTLDLKSRSKLVRSIPEFLSKLDRFAVSGMLEEDSVISDTEALHSDIEKISKLFSDYIQISDKASVVWNSFGRGFQGQLNGYGFYAKEFVAKLDNLIQLGTDVSLSTEAIQYVQPLGNTNLLVGVADQDHLLMLPGTMPLQKKIFGLLKAAQLMYVSCEIPTLEKLSEFSKISDQLLFVRSCGPIGEINFKEYLVRGYLGFAQTNPKLAFVQMHLPSLLQAGNGRLANPLPALAKQEWQNPFFNRVGWQEPTWDSSIKMFRTRAVIQAIEAYRPLSN